jgi:hypothetical protein
VLALRVGQAQGVSSMRVRSATVATAFAVTALVSACGAATPSSAPAPRAARPIGLRIAKLTGSVVELDPRSADAPLWLELRATVCVRSPLALYPNGIGVTHFVVSGHPRRWWVARSVVDHAPWLVPFGESWHGRKCGPVLVQDPIPSDHYGVESLGNPLSCYGVRLTIRVGRARASRRTIVRCGGLPARR